MEIRRVLSWDCAIKSIAWAWIEFRVDTGAKHIFLDSISFLSIGAADLIPGKKVNEVTRVERAKTLKTFLENGPISQRNILARDADGVKTIVYIENQPLQIGMAKHNTQANEVMSQLTFYYSEWPIVHVCPKYKSEIRLGGLLSLAAVETLRPNMRPYDQREMHMKACFYYVLTITNSRQLLETIPPDMDPDAAVALMQIFGYMAKKYKYTIYNH